MTTRPIPLLGLLAASLLTPLAVTAHEPVQAFLDALRERGYYDVALDYLSTAEKDPAVPAAFKETILYEKGSTLVQGARLQRDSALREKELDDAQKVLNEFIKAKPQHMLAIAARGQIANITMERARNRVEKSQKLTAAEKQPLLKQARDLYDQSSKTFTSLVDELRTKLKAYPATLDEKTDAKKIEERNHYREEFLQAQLLAAHTREDMADTMAKGSKEWTDTLTEAAKAYEKLYTDYRTRIAGLRARMFQARCLQKLGKHKEASTFFNELLANPDTPDAFHRLKLQVMPLAVDSWMEQKQYANVVDRPAKMIDAARPSEERSDEMLGMRLAVAKASKAYADQLKAKNSKDPEIRKTLTSGRKYVTYLTRFPNEYQDQARKLLSEFTGVEVESTNRPDPKTFAEAKDRAKEAIDAMQTANLLVKTLPAQIASVKGTDKPSQDQKADWQKQLADARQDATRDQSEAMRFCRLALKLAGSETDTNDVNLIRSLLCYLLYSDKQFYDAIAVGDFLAHRYPDSSNARQCAKIVLASYVDLYSDSSSDDHDFEADHIVSVADFIVKKWPDQPEAAEALNTLIQFMIRAKKLDQAQHYLDQIPKESEQRGSAELKMGQALWASYLESSKQIRDWESGAQPVPEGADLATQKTQLEELKSKARKTLEDGIERMRKKGDVTRVLATAVLYLAQIYVDTGEAKKAAALLEDPTIGTLTLAEKNDPAAQDDVVAEETYRTVLRAYISSLGQTGVDAKATIDKARRIMDALKKRMLQHPQGQQRLVATYFGLAQDLKRQMEIADPAAKKTLSEGFETFLKEVAADATELNVLNWVGDTYLAMGESFGTNFKTLTKQAVGYFTKAAETYQKILDKGKSDANFLPPQMATAIRIKLAKAKKYAGDYKGAADLLESILNASPMVLPAQIEAARLYQDWGGTGKGQERHYIDAIVGARPDDKKNGRMTFWGWGEIARMTANNPQFKDQFYDARYNLAVCRYQYALMQTDEAKRKQLMQAAQNDVSLTAKLFPELGGDEKRKQYDTLLKNIQKALGERPDGLKSLQQLPAKPATTNVSTTVPNQK
jgi:hypothetical protein